MIITEQIKCCNIDMGLNLLDDIKNRLNARRLEGSICTIEDITSDGLTWLTVHCKFKQKYPFVVTEPITSYVKGMVAGILVWSGVDVI